MTDRYESQLSALALIQAHRAGDIAGVASVILDTDPGQLHLGLVYLIDGALCTAAAASGRPVQDLIDAWRAGLLYAVGGTV